MLRAVPFGGAAVPIERGERKRRSIARIEMKMRRFMGLAVLRMLY